MTYHIEPPFERDEDTDQLDPVNLDGLTFQQWMQAVDREIARYCGLSHHDLADWLFWDNWHNCTPPEETARDVLEDNGFPFEDEAPV